MKRVTQWKALADEQGLSDALREKFRRAEELEICQAKRRFLSEDAALSTAAHVNSSPRFRKSSRRNRPYKCPICHFWHLTTSKPRD